MQLIFIPSSNHATNNLLQMQCHGKVTNNDKITLAELILKFKT